MIDRLREQLQERLDQLLGEADRLRKALAALDPRHRETPAPKPAARSAAAHGATPSRVASRDEARTGQTDEHARDSLPSPDGARRDQGRRCSQRSPAASR